LICYAVNMLMLYHANMEYCTSAGHNKFINAVTYAAQQLTARYYCELQMCHLRNGMLNTSILITYRHHDMKA
jgi:hypothetical protein